MELLKINIKDKIDKVINFDVKDADEANNTYVSIPRNGDLFKIHTDDCHVSNNGSESALYIGDVRIDKHASAQDSGVGDDGQTVDKAKPAANSNDLEITVMLVGERNNIVIDDNLNGIINVAEVPGEQQLQMVDNKPRIIKLTLIINNKKRTLNFVFQGIVCHAIVDFGSESSQARWIEENPNAINNNNIKDVNIIAGISDSMKIEADNKGYLQTDAGGQNLYRSIHFINKTLPSEKQFDLWNNYTDTDIKFLVRSNDAATVRDYLQIPNTKIINFPLRDVNRPTVTIGNVVTGINDIQDGIISRLVLNNVIYQTLKNIDNAHQNKQYGVVLYLMMPNVYPINIVAQKLNCLAEDIEGLIHNNNSFNKLIGVELRYVSESDASLLGYNNNNANVLGGGGYLIIDAGKGTLDFSLMDVSLHNGLTNTTRGGIVGAGAAITYGVTIGLLNDFLCFKLNGYKEKNRNDRIKDIKAYVFKITNEPDLANKYTLMNEIEMYKVFYNSQYGKKGSDVSTNEDAADDISSIGIPEFQTFIKSNIKGNRLLSEEGARFVTEEIAKIADVAVSQIMATLGANSNIGNILFTGRGSMMREFREVLLKKLKEKRILSDNANIIMPGRNQTPNPNEMKDGCMNIIAPLHTGNYDTGELKQRAVISYGINTSGGQPFQQNGHNNQRMNINDHIRHLFSSFGGYRHETSVEGSAAKGIEFEVNYANARITIGGDTFQIDRRFRKQKIKLFFDGVYYNIVSTNQNGVAPDQLSNTNRLGNHIEELGFDSLFPYVSTAGADYVPVRDSNPQAVNGNNNPQSNAPIKWYENIKWLKALINWINNK